MKQYAYFDANGMVLQTSVLGDDDDPALIEIGTGHVLIDGSVMPGPLAYVEGDVLKNPPEAPGPAYVFDWTSKTWTATLQDLKDAKWEEIKTDRSNAEFAPFTWDGSSFDANASAIQHISGAVQMALLAQLASQPFSIDWTLAGNTVRTLSGADMIAVGIAAGTHSGAVYDHARVLRDQIKAAATADAVAAVVW